MKVNNIDQQMIANINDLVAQMTVKEKIGQCLMVDPAFCLERINRHQRKYKNIDDPAFINLLVNQYHIGFFVFGGVTRVGDDSPRAWRDYIDKLNRAAHQNERHILPVYSVDAVHGVNFIQDATIFPHNLSIASTWQPNLAFEYAQLVGRDLATLGINMNLAPSVDLARDQRWGRVYETLGEDAYLASEMSEALVKGMQKDGNTIACAKHFVGYGESINGMDRAPVDISMRTLLEHHIPPFKSAINAGVAAIMVSGNDLNGSPVPASYNILTKLLRQRLNFTGFTLSDWEDVVRLQSRHHVTDSVEGSLVLAFNAGLDVNMIVDDLSIADTMAELVRSGRISMSRLDQAVRRILMSKFQILGVKKKYNVDLAYDYNSTSTRLLAQQIVEESLTLLKNNNNLLPLSCNMTSLLVVGEHANSKRHMCGGWTHSWGSAQEHQLHSTTLLEALTKSLPEYIKITYAKDVMELSKLEIDQGRFDACVAVISEEPHSEWIGDTPNLALEKSEAEILKSVIDKQFPTVVVGMSGRPQNLTPYIDDIDALLWVYLPGTEGAQVIVDTLFGKRCPSGKTPLTFPRSGSQVKINYNNRHYDCADLNTEATPLYPFGHGLSYTTFVYGALALKTLENGDLKLSISVTNTGQYDAQEVVQVYLENRFASVTRPRRQLVGFKKVAIAKGKCRDVELIIDNAQLSLYDADLNFTREPRDVILHVDDLQIAYRIE